MAKIMIIENDEILTHMMKTALIERGTDHPLEVIEAHSAAQAVELARTSLDQYDLFLVDYRLGAGIDGIALTKELLRYAPNAATILFTGYATQELIEELEDAGVDDYLPKPFEGAELAWKAFRQLKHRQARNEVAWLVTLSDVTTELHNDIGISELAEVVVHGAQRLGFARARFYRLFSVTDDEKRIVGVTQNGMDIADFNQISVALANSVYVRALVEKGELRYFQGAELGDGFLARNRHSDGWQAPVGEWVAIPLLHHGKCEAALLMDNGQQGIQLGADRKQHLKLFAEQLNGAFSRALEREMQLQKAEAEQIVANINAQMGTASEREQLTDICNRLHLSLQERFPQVNLIVVIKNEDGWLRNCFYSVAGEPQSEIDAWRPPEQRGLVTHLAHTVNYPLYLPNGTDGYRRNHNLEQIGDRPAKSWMGAQLWSAGRVVGAIVLEDDTQDQVFSYEDFAVLRHLAKLLEGRLYSAWLNEERTNMTNRLALLQQGTEDMMLLAEQRDDWLWHATLTLATAHYGFSFDRALLLFYDKDRNLLQGRMGIGHTNWQDAKRDWEEVDQNRNAANPTADWDQYLRQLRQGQLVPTRFEQRAGSLQIRLQKGDSAVAEVLETGTIQTVPAREVEQRLPPELFAFLYATDDPAAGYKETNCSIVPVKAGEEMLGVVILDNVWRRDPQQLYALRYLDKLTNQAALVYQNRQSAQEQTDKIELTYRTLNLVGDRVQSRTLEEICEHARKSLEADHVAVYPVRKIGEHYYYDFDGAGTSGNYSTRLPTDPQPLPIADEEILRGGQIFVVTDVRSLADDGQWNRHFLSRESIAAMLVIPIRGTVDDVPRALLYVDYLHPRTFRPVDLQNARHYDSLTQIALRQHRHYEESAIQRNAQEILATLIERATTAEVENESDLAQIILQETANLLPGRDIVLMLGLRKWGRSSPVLTVSERREQYMYREKTEPLIEVELDVFRGLSGYAMETDQTVHVPVLAELEEPLKSRYYTVRDEQSQAEVDVPIRIDGHVIGVLNAESTSANGFDAGVVEALERMAGAAGLAFANLRRQLLLRRVLDAAQAITEPLKLNATLEKIGEVIHDVVPSADLVTIWFQRQSSPDFVECGLSTGPASADTGSRRLLDELSIFQHIVAHEQDEIFAEDARNTLQTSGTFMERYGIESAAAHKLRVADDVFGIMLISYCRPHAFTREEKEALPLLASTVAAAINDARRLDEVERERQRFSLAHETTTAIGATIDMNESLDRLLHLLVKDRYFPDTTPAILLYDPETQRLNFTNATEQHYVVTNPDYAGRQFIALSEPSIVSSVAQESISMRQKRVWNTPDIRLCNSYMPLRQSTRSQLTVSLYHEDNAQPERGRLVGVLLLESDRPNAFDDDAEDLARLIATETRIVIERGQALDLQDFHHTVAGAMAWAAEAAHEINSEIFNIRSDTDELQTSGQLDEPLLEAVTRIEESLQRLSATAPLEHQIQSIIADLAQEIEAWISEAVEGLDPAYEISVTSDPEGIEIETYPLSLKRVIDHLVRNTIAACTGANIEQPRIGVSLRVGSNGHIDLHYTDNGPGVPPEVQSQILRIQIVKEGSESGGIGLLLCRFLIEQMGGKIRYQPSETPGAAFLISLPQEAVGPQKYN